MSGLLDFLPAAIRRCLQGQAAMLMGRMTPEGRAMSRGWRAWAIRVEEAKIKRERGIENRVAKRSSKDVKRSRKDVGDSR